MGHLCSDGDKRCDGAKDVTIGVLTLWKIVVMLSNRIRMRRRNRFVDEWESKMRECMRKVVDVIGEKDERVCN